jgi:RNA polymerase sigma-70 factor (family 1)
MEEKLPVLLDGKKISGALNWTELLPLANKSNKVIHDVTLVEKVLISKLKAGDRSAFTYIFTAYYPDLVLFTRSFTHDLSNAEEIVQDTFVGFWEEHESIQINISLKSYLLKMVQNKCIDCYRHKKIMQIHNTYLLESPTQYTADTDNYILYSELQKQIDIALGKLPEEISEAFRMNRQKGLKYHEIADISGVSVRTIEVRIGKALHMLRDCLKEYFTVIVSLICLFF